MDQHTFNVLFLCTGNSARSIFAEAMLNHLGAGRFRGYSAGSHPRGEVHPLTIRCLENSGASIAGLHSKGWEEFAGAQAPSMQFVITVCDQAAGEICPVWPGQPMTAHWGFEDPAAVIGPEDDQRKAFQKAMHQIANRISIFVNGNTRPRTQQVLFNFFLEYMESSQAVKSLAALAQESRLAIFRNLVQAGPAGLPAGQLSDSLGIAPSSLTIHMKELSHAGLVTSRHVGRFVIYSAAIEAMNALLTYLSENCCGGNPCSPITSKLCVLQPVSE